VETITNAVNKGVTAFLLKEFAYSFVFILFYGTVLIILPSYVGEGALSNKFGFRFDQGGFTAVAFAVGAITSLIATFVSVKAATAANARVAVAAIVDGQSGYIQSFNAALNGGGVSGFFTAGLGVLSLYTIISLFAFHFSAKFDTHAQLFKAVTGYGLGAAAAALFTRVGGGIFSKSSFLGVDLAGRLIERFPGHSASNPATIALAVGNNVADVGGLGSELFASFAEATVASLFLGTSFGANTTDDVGLQFYTWGATVFPLIISATGILVGVATQYVSTVVYPVRRKGDALRAVKVQLAFSGLINTAALYPIIVGFLPNGFAANPGYPSYYGTDIKVFFSIGVGLWAALIIAFSTEYFTSYEYSPAQRVATAGSLGVPSIINAGLADSYTASVIPTLAIAADVFVSFHILGLYGVSLSALGLLMTLTSAQSLNAFASIAGNADSIARLAGLPTNKTSDYAAAGTTAAAIGKAVAAASSTVVTLTLIGAFYYRYASQIATVVPFPNVPSIFCSTSYQVDILQPIVFASLIVGGLLPYWFASLTTGSVGKTAELLSKEVARQLREIPGLLEGNGAVDNDSAVSISTGSTFKGLVFPAFLVLFAPLLSGIVLGVNSLIGLLIGALISGTQLSLSSANAGGVFDGANKFAEKGGLKAEIIFGSEQHRATQQAVQIGEPLKDAVSPGVNVAIKLIAITALVYSDFFTNIHQGAGAFDIVPRCNAF